MAVAVAVNCYVDWNNDADFGDSNEDVSTYLQSASVRRGRSSVNDEFSPGSMTVELDNQTGLFSPFYAAGALYGSILPGRAIKLEAVHSAVTYPVFYGYVTDYQQSRTPDGRPSVVIQAFDAFDVLRLGEIRTELLETVTVDSAIGTFLDDAGWSASLRDLDTSVETIDRIWQHRATPLAAIRAAAKQELGGQLHMSRDGKVTFRNRDYRSSQAVYATITGPQALGFAVRREDFYDSIHHTVAGLVEDASATALYTLSPQGRELMPGSTDPRNTIHFELSMGGKSLVTPVATTDYNANAQADGGGTDKTAQVTVSSFTAYGGGGTVVFDNLDSSPVYLYGTPALQVRGTAIRRSTDDRAIEVAATAPVVSGQVLSDAFDWNDNVDGVSGYAHYRAGVFSAMQPRPTIRLIPSDDTEMATVLGGEIGKRITVTNTSGLYPTQMNDDFFIEGISISFSPGVLVDCSWNLWARDQGMGRFFRISGASGGGADYSTIADTTGVYDRLAF